MLKAIEILTQGKILTVKEQKEIFGGLKCNLDGGCDNPDFCCSHGYCVSMKPDPGGLVPACE